MLRWLKGKSEFEDLDPSDSEVPNPAPQKDDDADGEALPKPGTSHPSTSTSPPPIPSTTPTASGYAGRDPAALQRRQAESSPSAFHTFIGKGVCLVGTLQVPGSIRIEGVLKGQIRSDSLLEVSQGGTVQANLTLGQLVIAGDVEGEVMVREDAELLPGGRLLGTLKTSSLNVHRGAILQGKCSMGKD